MTAPIDSYGRLPGYPAYSESVTNKKLVKTYTDRWNIEVSDENALGETIIAALPSDFDIGASLGAECKLKSRALKRSDKARLLYYLDLTYTNDQDDQTGEQSNLAPDQRQPEWAWDFETVGYVLRKDVDDNTIFCTNSANEPFEIETEIAIPILTIERWEAFFDPSTIIDFINHRNAGTFWTASAGAVVCTGIRDRKDTTEVSTGIAYRKVTYNFKFMVPFIADVMEGAKEILADIGTRYKLTAGATTYTEYRSTGGMPTKCALNTNGTLRTAAETLLFKKFNKFPAADFNELGIDWIDVLQP